MPAHRWYEMEPQYPCEVTELANPRLPGKKLWEQSGAAMTLSLSQTERGEGFHRRGRGLGRRWASVQSRGEGWAEGEVRVLALK